MNYDQECAFEDILEERGIELDAMSDAEVEGEFARQFGQLPGPAILRFDMIERLLTKLRSEQ